MCPNTIQYTLYVSSNYYVCAYSTIIYVCLLTMDLRRCISQHGVNIVVVIIVVNVVCALILLYVSSGDGFTPQHLACVLILLHMCPHTSGDWCTPLHLAAFLLLYLPLYLLQATDLRRCISQQPSDTLFLPPPSSFQSYYMFPHFLLVYLLVYLLQVTGVRRCISQQPSDTLFTRIFTTIFTTGDGFTPLHLAAAFGHSFVVTTLLSRGANALLQGKP
jgi:hypothetical protein